MLGGIVIFLAVAPIAAAACQLKPCLHTPQNLFEQYYTVFPSGNRNAASHRWSAYVIERSQDMDRQLFQNMMGSFCTVSGSPVGNPGPQQRWKVTLSQVGGGKLTGVLYHCCAPCTCDTQEFIKVDTKTITTKDGPEKYHFAVIGNPCLHPEKLAEQFVDPFSGRTTTLQDEAPDVKCVGSNLEKAVLSDHGHIILGMFFPEGTPGHATPEIGFTDSSEMSGFCGQRAQNGHASGMGEIFRKVALISPLHDKEEDTFLPSWLV